MTQIFGAIGFAGLAVAATAFLVLGARGAWLIKLDHLGVIITGFIVGQLYAQAGQDFACVGDVSGSLSQAVQSSFGHRANFGAGAVALIVCLLLFGLKPRKIQNGALSMMAPTLFTAAGGSFAIVTHLISNLLATLVSSWQ